MGLAVTGVELDGRTVGLRCEGELISALGPDVAAEAGDEVIAGEGLRWCRGS
jgi:hypothetical protein